MPVSLYATANSGPSILVKRDASGIFTRRECRYDLFIDGKPFATLKYGQAARIYPPPGQHIVGMRAPDWICNSSGEHEVPVDLEATGESALRITIDVGGGATLQRTAF